MMHYSPEPESTSITLTCIVNDGIGASYFSEESIPLTGDPMRMLSAQQNAENFRIRTSAVGYVSGWHTAGDPTLLVILSGQLVIELRNGESKTFGTGDMFVAKDYLEESAKHNDLVGHRAQVIGNTELTALHIKLNRINT